MQVKDLTIIYYTSNLLDEVNPYFLENTKKQLLKAAGEIPIISVSHKPIDFGENICVGDIGRSHLNLYKQILIGARAAKTKYVALAEDDIFYSYQHFRTYLPKKDHFAYDMNKWSIFTWTKPPQYSFRNRMVVNHLIAERDMLVEALEERFAKHPDPDKTPLSYWGDPGRYEKYLGVSVRKTEIFFSSVPGIVFTHKDAFGYLNHGKRKRLGNPRAYDIPVWGRVENMLKLYDKNTT